MVDTDETSLPPSESLATVDGKRRPSMAQEPFVLINLAPTSAAHQVLSIDPVALVTTECITITSAMRKHARWAQSSISAILGGGVSRTHDDEILRPASLRSKAPHKAPSITDPLNRTATPTGRSSVADDDDSSLASRWGLRGKKGKSMADNPLLSAFARLRRDLAGCQDVSAVDAPELLHPFLQVIRSSSTSAAITSLAVISITKFLAYNLITDQSPRIGLAMHLLSAAITHCRFEASDTSADEVVLLRILRLMESIMARPEGRLLGDESICEMMSTGLSMCCQARLSDILRRSAEMAMVTMCQVVFGRLKELEVIAAPPRQRSRSTTLASLPPTDDLKIKPAMTGSVMGNGGPSERPSVDGERSLSTDASTTTSNTSRPEQQTPSQSNGHLPDEVRPYGLASIKELFRVLIDLLDPHNKTHTDQMRIMALRVIDVALEVAGPAIAQQPLLAELVQDPLCRHLFQLVRSDNMVLLNSSLRVAGTLLSTCRKILKLQQELFLSYLIACLHPKVEIPQEPGIDPSLYEGVPSQPGSGRSTPVPVKDRQRLGLEGGLRRPEAREAMIESIGTLIRLPSFMVELFLNYDCEVDRQDLCEDMVGLLSRNAFPDSATWSTTNVPPLCLDALLSFIQFMADRLNQPTPPEASSRIKLLRYQRARKKVIKVGATKFNEDPMAGVAYLVKNGIIKDPDDPVHIAQFLKGTSHVSKKVLGEFLTKRSNERLLTAFIELFNFRHQRIDESLRDLLGSFRLPGESALIERIINIFSEKYCRESAGEDIADKDAAFVLTYAIIMLNTDLYNPNVKGGKRMGPDDFARNLRGVNAKKDFAPDYLAEIYDAIKGSEIILPDEHDNKHAFEYAWKELLMKTHNAGELELCETNAFDAEMFAANWRPIIATLNYVFMSASDDAVYSRVVAGFDQCAQIAGKYAIYEAFDRIIYSLCQMGNLASEIPPSTSLNTEVQHGKNRIMVSELAVRLGRDFRAQLSTVLLFKTLFGHEGAVGETWIYIVRILRNLFVNSLIQPPSVEKSRLADLGPIPLQSPSQVIDRDGKLAESGLFSTFTSYLSSYAADDPPEPSEEEIENTLSTVDCVSSCHPELVIDNMFSLSPRQSGVLVKAILSQTGESSPVVTVKPERPMPVTTRMNGGRTQRSGLQYDPGTVFLLELATMLTLRDPETVASGGDSLMATLQNFVRDASNLHPLVSSRVVSYLLNMLKYSFTHDFTRTPVVLHTISSFSDDVLASTAPSIMDGLASCLLEPTPLRIEITNSPDFWSILHRLHQHKSESGHVFEILVNVATSSPTPITADNYEATVNLANDFIALGRIGASIEQRHIPPNQRKLKEQPKPERTADNVVVQRAITGISLIYNITSLTPSFIEQSHLDYNEAWAAYWSPIFRALCTQCVNPCREVRYRAMSALQRVLLSEELAHQPERTDLESENEPEWTAIFTEVLFPLVLRLLKPEVYQSDVVGMSETRVQAATLLCKIYLRYLDLLAMLPPLVIDEQPQSDGDEDNSNHDKSNDDSHAKPAKPPSTEKASKIQTVQKSRSWLLLIWTRTLDLLDRMLNSGVATRDQEVMQEAVTEGIKNCLLVMNGSDYLLNPDADNGAATKGVDDKDKAELWKETARKVDRVCPGLMAEVFSPPTHPSAPHTPAAKVEPET
ncbi:hypothetical protein DV736_g2473, partial [Chaetothyriales sp. CBS 134916]